MRVWLVVMWALAVIFAAISLVVLSRPARAQATCAPLPNLIQGLRDKFSEHVVVQADAGDRTMIVTRSDKGSWSLIIVRGEAACTTTKGSFCEIAKPVRLGSAAIDALSDAEVKAILAHNQKGERLCGWRK